MEAYFDNSATTIVTDSVKDIVVKTMTEDFGNPSAMHMVGVKAEKYIKEVVTKDYDLKKIAALVKTRIEIFPDIKEQIDFFEELPEYDTAMYCHKKMKTNEEKALEVLKEIYPLLEKQDDFSNNALFEILKSYVDEKGFKTGYVMWPIRTAVSGKQSTPGGATEIMEILGKEESLKRIQKGIELLER